MLRKATRFCSKKHTHKTAPPTGSLPAFALGNPFERAVLEAVLSARGLTAGAMLTACRAMVADGTMTLPVTSGGAGANHPSDDRPRIAPDALACAGCLSDALCSLGIYLHKYVYV